MDVATATTLAQILPVLLLTMTVELRRTQVHRAFPRILFGSFFVVFGIVETTLVLSIDGMFYPFQASDLFSALIIFALLLAIFRLSFVETNGNGNGGNGTGNTTGDTTTDDDLPG